MVVRFFFGRSYYRKSSAGAWRVSGKRERRPRAKRKVAESASLPSLINLARATHQHRLEVFRGLPTNVLCHEIADAKQCVTAGARDIRQLHCKLLGEMSAKGARLILVRSSWSRLFFPPNDETDAIAKRKRKGIVFFSFFFFFSNREKEIRKLG